MEPNLQQKKLRLILLNWLCVVLSLGQLTHNLGF
jgi:hypothetical protein